jgi:hypothetical protein
MHKERVVGTCRHKPRGWEVVSFCGYSTRGGEHIDVLKRYWMSSKDPGKGTVKGVTVGGILC